ncbi:hypothetical protein SeMB42_g01021 [Synchytrium endobioticum]|uniref:Uncharacterized protein n=1 Tax=Synchytrium endobioticum TaxID=286115 RepID=A0A507DQ89_9FUNG|nr:hypothetical protein SeMB42_g01021 [Synchytrium endobioticum]
MRLFQLDEGDSVDPPDPSKTLERRRRGLSRIACHDHPLKNFLQEGATEKYASEKAATWRANPLSAVVTRMNTRVVLPNVFHDNSLLTTHQDIWVIALDPRATCITGAVTKCLTEPERLYGNWLEADKPEAISEAERDCTKSDDKTWAAFLERFVISYDIARTYYSSRKYKRKRWDADKANRRKLDKVLEGIFNMVDESMGQKLSGGKKVIAGVEI